ncbi:hypothetical protein ACFL3D_01400 [Candidatus Omnitrophota bacterium]
MKTVKTIFILLLAGYGIWGAFHSRAFWILDGMNLAIHESGHLIFGIFGNEFVQFLGGTLMQLLMPLAFVVHFAWHYDYYSAGVMLWWVGQNFFHIAPYIKDARTQAIPLVGGGIHDWGYLLGHLRVLQHDQLIGSIAWAMGISIIVISIVIAWYHREVREESEF